MEPALAFRNEEFAAPGLDIRVNFGIFAGRQATPAEIDELADALLTEVRDVSIVAEERHEIGDGLIGSGTGKPKASSTLLRPGSGWPRPR